MAAAYAALVSVMNILEQIQNHPRHSFNFDNKQIESLRENVDFMVDFLECYSHGCSKEAEALESQIASAAHEGEDVIESHIVDQIHDGSSLNGETNPHFLFDLQKLIGEMDSLKEMAMKVKSERGFRDQLHTYSRPATSSTGKNAMVGFDDELIQLMERLTGSQRNRQIIPIVGMGGIGKTTLARNIYEHLLIVQHFDVRLWATISQEYSVEDILLELLSRQEESTSETVDELGEQLYKSLSGKRYLIILDDVWGIDAWDEIKMFFPDNGNRSRVVVTTRISNMAIDFSSSALVMNFLDENKSWKLFSRMAFGGEGCPADLEEIGSKIVQSCKGLPLSLVVVGGHLGKSSRTKGYWEEVANDINSILDSGDDDEQSLNILSLSYSYLPVYLKPCFLYIGIFPEDEKIWVSHLIKLWIAEGFLKPNKAQSFEDVAEGYLRDLFDRNLILVHEWNCNGKIDTFTIHDLLRELCIRVAEKEKFFCALDNDTLRAIHTERRVVIHEFYPREDSHPEIFHALRSAQLVRSLKWEGGELPFHLRLLRVLNRDDALTGASDSRSLGSYFQQVNLRYFYYYHTKIFPRSLHLPSSISQLWNLQTLKIMGADRMKVIVPSEIWEMPQLRHVELELFCLPDPLPSDRLDQQGGFVLQNLQTLMEVENFKMSEEVCKRIPNITELHVKYNDFRRECEASSYYCPHNLGHFHKLELLCLYFSAKPNWRDFVLSFIFPSSLAVLFLQGCRLHWEDLAMIGLLPHLKVLHLDQNSVVGPEWNVNEGQFLRLKSLKMISCNDLICWNADSSHFPVLEELFLSGMLLLDEIPSGIGEIPTLEIIELDNCSVSAAFSALEVLVEQEELGNEGLQLEVNFWDEEERECFLEMMQAEGFVSNNLHLHESLT